MTKFFNQFLFQQIFCLEICGQNIFQAEIKKFETQENKNVVSKYFKEKNVHVSMLKLCPKLVDFWTTNSSSLSHFWYHPSIHSSIRPSVCQSVRPSVRPKNPALRSADGSQPQFLVAKLKPYSFYNFYFYSNWNNWNNFLWQIH